MSSSLPVHVIIVFHCWWCECSSHIYHYFENDWW